MFTAIVVTGLFFDWLLENNMIDQSAHAEYLSRDKDQFHRLRKVCYITSLVMLLRGCSYSGREARKLWHRFLGRDHCAVCVQDEIKIDEIRSALAELGLNEAAIQQFRDRP